MGDLASKNSTSLGLSVDQKLEIVDTEAGERVAFAIRNVDFHLYEAHFYLATEGVEIRVLSKSGVQGWSCDAEPGQTQDRTESSIRKSSHRMPFWRVKQSLFFGATGLTVSLLCVGDAHLAVDDPRAATKST